MIACAGMDALKIILILVFVLSLALLVSPKMRGNQGWSSMVTPLASIIGSGFLVSVPLLASSIGIWSLLAVAGLTLLAFLVGSAIRYNISHAETELQSPRAGHPMQAAETMSHFVLIGAYFVSVSYYLVLLATFGLKIAGLHDPILVKVIASSLALLICGVGATKGLEMIEGAEKFTVSGNLAAIAALLACLIFFGVTLPEPYHWGSALDQEHTFDAETLRFLLGLLIIVQGFETTRFMGDMYKAPVRVKAMRNAQILSSLVYLVFFALMIPLFPYFTSSADVAGFIEVIKRVSPWLPFLVTGGAVASQLSAAVADSIGASGLLSQTSHQHISPKQAYLLIGLVSCLIIWGTDVVSIVALASRAFAVFYALQCLVASLCASHHKNDKSKAILFGLLAFVCALVAIFGTPSGG